jgi:NTP pyrophosphatase (non-canonical NTP hydrolase)
MNFETYQKYFVACKIIFEHYGEEKQKIQLIQELSELVVALTKNDLENILEEMADVQIMLDQFCQKKEYGDRVTKIQHDKINRQLDRINADESLKLNTVA